MTGLKKKEKIPCDKEAWAKMEKEFSKDDWAKYFRNTIKPEPFCLCPRKSESECRQVAETPAARKLSFQTGLVELRRFG